MPAIDDTLDAMLHPGMGVLVLDEYTDGLLGRHRLGSDAAGALDRAVLESDAIGRSLAGVLTTRKRLSALLRPWPDSWQRARIGVRIDGLAEGLAPWPAIASARRDGARFVELRANRRPGQVRRGDAHVPAIPMLRAASEAQAHDLLPVFTVAMPGLDASSLPVTQAVIANALKALYSKAGKHGVDVSRTVLRVAPIAPGYRSRRQPWPTQIAHTTLDTLQEVLPDEVPAVWFLSAGHSLDVTCDHLRAISNLAAQRGVPWQIGFAAGRALIAGALTAWAIGGARQAMQRLEVACDSLNSAAGPHHN